MGMTDREKVIKGLEHCANEADCRGCVYQEQMKDRSDGCDCMREALAMLKEQESVIEALKSDLNETLAVLGEQAEIVRCRDCKYWSAERINDFNKCRRWIKVGVKNFATMGDWFCADGKRR